MEASFFLSPLRGFCGTGVPAPTCRRSALHPGGILQRHSPCAHLCGRSAPRPGLLSRVEKVGKDTPRAVPFGIPRCVVTALFALAALRSGSRRATFSH